MPQRAAPGMPGLVLGLALGVAWAVGHSTTDATRSLLGGGSVVAGGIAAVVAGVIAAAVAQHVLSRLNPKE